MAKLKVTTMQIQENNNEICLFFSRSKIIKDIKIKKEVENHKEDKQWKCI